MAKTEPSGQRDTIIAASLDQHFTFEQGSSLHVGILGMALRPSGQHDEGPFFRGSCVDGHSHGRLDLSQVQPTAGDDEPDVEVWFEPERIMIDLSAAFADAPAEALAGSGIPAAVVDGPVSSSRRGDAGDGSMALLTQLGAGKTVLDPAGMMRMAASDNVTGFAEHDIADERPLRGFHAEVSLHHFLSEMGLTSMSLINQVAMLGYDLRTEGGAEVVALFDEHLRNNSVQLAWFIDEHDRIHTVQAIITLTEFIQAVVSSDEMVERMAHNEPCPVEEMRAFVDQCADSGRLVYANAIWQQVHYLEDPDDLHWPESEDLSDAMANQARLLREFATMTEPEQEAALAATRTGSQSAQDTDQS